MRIGTTARAIAVSLALIAVLALGADPVSAETRLSGAGGRSCGVLLTRMPTATPEGRAAIQWSLGYLTGRAAGAPAAAHRPFSGPEGIVRDLVEYCRHDPGAQVADAAAAFFEE